MRILHTESSDNWGGQEYRIIEQMQWLRQTGFVEVDLFVKFQLWSLIGGRKI